MQPTTPIGSFTMRPFASSSNSYVDAISDALRNPEMPVPTWIAAESGFGMPTSWVITSAISSRRASSSSATRRSSLPRSGADVSDHAGNAALAAATARSMSAGVPAGIVA